jgi:hypothetical protein
MFEDEYDNNDDYGYDYEYNEFDEDEYDSRDDDIYGDYYDYWDDV